MKDCKGVELMLGDRVVYVHGKNTDAYLETGIVTKFYGNECSVGSATHVKTRRIMKLDDIARPKEEVLS